LMFGGIVISKCLKKVLISEPESYTVAE
jgi:hypothetical protein